MSGGGRRARKPRPNRHRHFRGLWALIWREAAYQYLVGRFGFQPHRPSRGEVWKANAGELRDTIKQLLLAYPERKEIP